RYRGDSEMTDNASAAAVVPDISFSGADLLIHSLSYDLDRPVVQFSDTGRIVTAREFRDVISCYAQALNDLGLPKGTRVGLLSRNRPEVLFVNGAFAFAP